MARIQTLASGSKTVAAAATPEQLQASQEYCKSVIVQANANNTDFVYVGDSSSQVYALSPGKSIEIHGDNLDLGGGAKLDVSSIYVRVLVNGEGVNYMKMQGI